MQTVELLIIGAGPFGLSLAGHTSDLGIDTLVVGKPMEFWKNHMPEGMFLRSGIDWYLDAGGVYTIERFLAEQGLKPAEVQPLSRNFYLSYTQWFQERKAIKPVPAYVTRLDQLESTPDARFSATLDDGRTVCARHVAIAVGCGYFSYIPPEHVSVLPAGRWIHSRDLVDCNARRGKRVLVVGGRQSAYEWAALLHEAGATHVHISHDHTTPDFTASDWSWVSPITDAMVDNPAWFRNLPKEEQDNVSHRMWAEGRLKLEPWLASRIHTDGITLWPKTKLTGCTTQADGSLEISLDSGDKLVVDEVVLATGYKVQVNQLPFLSAGNILPNLTQRNGYPVLDDHFQTNVPGLFITSMAANQDFGPFFGFTVSCRTSSRIIGKALRQMA